MRRMLMLTVTGLASITASLAADFKLRTFMDGKPTNQPSFPVQEQTVNAARVTRGQSADGTWSRIRLPVDGYGNDFYIDAEPEQATCFIKALEQGLVTGITVMHSETTAIRDSLFNKVPTGARLAPGDAIQVNFQGPHGGEHSGSLGIKLGPVDPGSTPALQRAMMDPANHRPYLLCNVLKEAQKLEKSQVFEEPSRVVPNQAVSH